MISVYEAKKNDPYISVESNIAFSKKSSKKNKNSKYVRKIYKRSVAWGIIDTILSFGFYLWFWQFEIAKETNKLSDDDSGFCPAMVVFLSIITFGIYLVYWGYKIGKKQSTVLDRQRNTKSNYHITFLVLLILNYVVPFLYLVVIAIMQANVNQMLATAQKTKPNGIYVKDSNIFNRPFLSCILLILIATIIPGIISSIYESLFIGYPGNSLNSTTGNDVVQDFIANSAAQTANADTPFMMAHCLIQIFSIIGILWWFWARFKHSNYQGVLCFRNLGRALLFALPGFAFVAINVLGISIANFKFGIILLGFVPAFAEEITFRGMVIPNFMRVYNKSMGIWLSLFISAAIFALVHASNILSGADVGTTFFQVGYTFALGILFAAILIRTGNLWPCILIHGLVDTLAYMTPQALEHGAVLTEQFEFSLDLLPIIIIAAIFIGYGIWICRPKKHDEICKLWANKWGDAILNGKTN